MKTNIRNAITAAVFLLTPIVYGAGNESLYMESVGRINPSMAQVLTGEVQVSGIQSPTKLTLDLLLSNGSLYTVNDILHQNYHLLWRGDRLRLVILDKSDSVQHLYRHLRRNIRAIKIPLQIDNLFFSCISLEMHSLEPCKSLHVVYVYASFEVPKPTQVVNCDGVFFIFRVSSI